ncbi:hypothetical protein FEM33_10430 [Dyadobacter flavalbus]|uniref:Fibrobacter succinogenes major paralogous domain-containing protein n=1 Tax=Dyadobacter flavalbus TaxID=2579942 RepID=A0A5M8QWZ7_9BACT|nr:FISUMP domain-containing protein [Dyadobacter flavalbus]KAA6439858.1 hypothetical protein FEM33_10430 [Dyadobacter flavalbus]
MKNLKNQLAMICAAAMLLMVSCKNENNPVPPEDPVVDGEVGETPYTTIPDEFVGTWYPDHNQGPLSTNWEQGTFQGEQGFREFRTMVFTKNGKNAVEYTSEVFNSGDEVLQYLYKLTGTLEYKANNPSTLTFHAQTGRMKVFSNKYSGFKESAIRAEDLKEYESILSNPQATTYTSSVNYLDAKRVSGGVLYTVKYKKVDASNNPDNGGNSGDPYSNPPSDGTYVKIINQYYPTVTIGNLEWTSVNYSGTGGIKEASKPQYGTFYKFADIQKIPLPAGWRIPTRQDYINLIKSQGIAYDEQWNTTNGEDLQSKKLLGNLMSVSGWLKEDGYANNKSGFNAVPANLRVTNGSPNGEGTNCLLWTSDKDENDLPIVFKLIQLPSDTYAALSGQSIGYNPPHIPLRFVRDK